MATRSCIAMLLAGGEGRRLAPLTRKLAKPAVPFGGRYRIIDFPLSNCVNSGISTVGVLTQYRAESLHGHLADGSHWQGAGHAAPDIIAMPGGTAAGTGYLGTADAICKNIETIDKHSPEHVLVLSGDHIYTMDYRPMLEAHRRTNADATIAVKRVPPKEAHRFGIMKTDDRQRIVSFAEKPAKPESDLASMGIYLFRWPFLREHLLVDAMNADSSHDFGKDVIPTMLRCGYALYGYPFEGYWRDVGTVESLWEAHMDMLRGELQLDGRDWPIYTNDNVLRLPAYTHPLAEVRESMVHPHTSIEGNIDRSVIFGGVHIGRGSSVRECVIMPNVTIGRNVRLNRAVIGEGSVIQDGAVIGRENGEIIALGADELILPRTGTLIGRTNELLKGIVRPEAAPASESV